MPRADWRRSSREGMLNDTVPGGSPPRGRGSSRDSASAAEAATSPPFTGSAESRVYWRTRDGPAGLANGSHRALWTPRLSRHADQRSQLHDRLIEPPGTFAVCWNQCAGELPDLAGCGMRDAGCEEHSSNHPRHIRVDRWYRLLICETRYRPRCVRSDPRKLDQLFRMIGQRAVEVFADYARERVEIRGTSV